MENGDEHISLMKKGENLDSVLIVSSDEDDIEVIEGENLETRDTTDQNTEADAEDYSNERVDVSGSLVGLKRKTIDDMHNLYRDHSRALGFSIRKATTRTQANGVVTEKYFVCSCEGFRKSGNLEINSKNEKKKNFPITRTGCNASLRVKLNDEGLYEVLGHVTEHNHPFTRKEWNHLHRSERKITSEKGKVIEDMVSSGMRPIDSYRYMAHEAGGDYSVGHTIKDHLNFVNRLKLKEIEGGDAQTLVEMLYQQQSDEEDFFFRVKLDEMAKLSNVFWRDSMMREDYEIFGDVVIFDTTYRTNRYNLICAPIVGINHHWKNVMFGCAFLSNEKTETFEWLFEVFKKAMGGKFPITIFTDQDQAISNAIEKVFPGTKHRLCQWHLYQNAISRFGQLKSNNSFKNAFRKCLSGCTDEVDFENSWSNMISTYGLEDQTWFKRLYEIKEKWCTALSKDFFSAGILSSQRSESTNNAMGFNAKKTTSLTDFYGIFKELVKNWRMKEQNDEFQSSRSIPSTSIPLTGLLKHVSEVYTLTMFKDFESEFIASISTTCTLVHNDEILNVYDVSSHIGDGGVSKVMFDPLRNMVTCTCKKFEECGILCFHSLRVLHLHSHVRIPEIYILKRWTRMEKSRVWDILNKRVEKPDKPNDCIPWRHEMARRYYDLVLKCQGNEEARRIIEEGYERDFLAIGALTNVQNSTGQNESSAVSSTANTLQDPTRSVTKGRRKRIKGSLEKSKKKTSDVSDYSQAKEFGSKTPNPRLF